MKTIKRINSDKKNYLTYLNDGEKYRAYEIGNLPVKFGKYEEDDKGNKYPLVGKWFTCSHLGSGHAGLTFISEDYFPKWN